MKQYGKKLLSGLMALAMCLSLLPASALGVDMETGRAFDTALEHTDKYLYRVGNANAVALDRLFKLTDDFEAAALDFSKFSGNEISIEVTTIAGDASGSYDKAVKAVQFSGAGVVRVDAKLAGGSTTAYRLNLEVVDGTNATTAMSATGGNVVLLADINCGGGTVTVSNGHTLFGNGYTLTFTGIGAQGSNKVTNFAEAYVKVDGGSLENVQVKCPLFPESYGLVPGDDDKGLTGTYRYMLSAVRTKGESRISNSYIYGGRTNVFFYSGSAAIENTVLECGATANIQSWGSDIDTLTLDNVTTIQYLHNKVYGAGVLIGNEDVNSNTKLVIKGALNQYNWLGASQVSDIQNYYIQFAAEKAVEITQFQHAYDGDTYVNFGVIYLDDKDAVIEDSRPNHGGYESADLSFAGYHGKVYSVCGGTVELKDSTYAYEPNSNGLYRPNMNFAVPDGETGVTLKQDGTVSVEVNEGADKSVDLAAYVNPYKYSNLTAAIKVSSKTGNQELPLDGSSVTFSKRGSYVVTYEVTDSAIYDKNANRTDESVTYAKEVPFNISVVNNLPDAELKFDQSTQRFYYYPFDVGPLDTDNKQYLPLLNGLKIYDYTSNGEKTLVFDGDGHDYSSIIRYEHSNSGNCTTTFYFQDNTVLKMVYDARANTGGSTYSTTLMLGGDGVLYAVNNGGTSAAEKAFYWHIDRYEYTGRNGRTVTVRGSNSLTTDVTKVPENSTLIDNAKGATTYRAERNQIMQFDAQGNPKDGVVFIGTKGPQYRKEYATNDKTTYKFEYGYGAEKRELPTWVPYDPGAHKVTLNGNAPEDQVMTDTPFLLTTGALDAEGYISREGFEFDGWYTQPIGGEKVGTQTNADGDWTLSGYSVTGDVDLYAHWLKDVTISFDTQGAGNVAAVNTRSGLSYELPAAPERSGFDFAGWSLGTVSPENVVLAGTTQFATEEDAVWYANWLEKAAVQYTVTYNVSGGTAVSTAEVTVVEGQSITLPETTYAGIGGTTAKSFAGWFTAASGGTRVGGSGDSYTPTGSVKLYAQWTVKTYTLTFSIGNSNGSNKAAKADPNKLTDIPYGATISYNNNKLTVKNGNETLGTVSYSHTSGYEINGWKVTVTVTGAADNEITSDSSAYPDSAKTVTGNMSIYCKTGSGGCFADGTLITLADGTQKPIEQIETTDKLRTYNFFTGEYEEQPIALLVNHGYAEYPITNLHYSDGTMLRLIYEHGTFDYDLNKFVYVTPENYEEYLGHRFVKDNGESGYELVTLESVEVTNEYSGLWSITSAANMDAFANDMLTIAPPDDFYNWIPMGEKLRYDAAAFAADVETYGLYTYEDFADFVTYDQFIAFNGAYLKAPIEKGLITWDYLVDLIDVYQKYMPDVPQQRPEEAVKEAAVDAPKTTEAATPVEASVDIPELVEAPAPTDTPAEAPKLVEVPSPIEAPAETPETNETPESPAPSETVSVSEGSAETETVEPAAAEEP